MFGYTSLLNFDKQGPAYNTFQGGTVSILLLSFLMYLFCGKLYTMFTFGSDTINIHQEIADFESIGPLNMKEMGNVMFYLPEYKRRFIYLD